MGLQSGTSLKSSVIYPISFPTVSCICLLVRFLVLDPMESIFVVHIFLSIEPAMYWKMVDLPKATPLDKTDSHLSRSY